ncbi:MAG: NUDIX hydrolase [Saprospiraceae bacterium]|nr:NUDIX hydrolase [Saprospiraceae bacterium]MCF8250427.1 NUDIX hydrolase [Saprospiraceae bacterium]MCF8280653.1 NUDIX hydrolase [Bacteroidales bacterium]MCF8312198.1 NUDIX hydrolase [Saprospiraceae bacterium]MCF8440539.1 NUDIX hydrolase [Saprospiraceae bacterium]
MNFCSNCGSSELTNQVPEGDNRLRQVCGNCGEIHYRNPKIIAGCLPIWDGKVLLCRRAINPRAGFWNVPAGFLEIGETVEAGAMREVWEEALAKVLNLRLQTVFTFTNYWHVYIQFVGELKDGKFGVGEESTETRLFSEAEIPWDEIAFESSRFAIHRYFEDRKLGDFKVHLGSL